MKVALVHDYLREFGGAERVLEALSELYPDAPIYTAFFKEDSEAYKRFKYKKIITSWAQHIPFFATKLHSPLRFLAPFIWGSFNFSKYDVVITSAGWYITKGVIRNKQPFDKTQGKQATSNKKPIEFCYCHTPPRWLYGYKTAVGYQKYLLVRIYAHIIGHFMRLYDFTAAQKVDFFIANSKEVQARIKKFYRRDSVVIYPPVSLPRGPVTRSFPASAPASLAKAANAVRAVGSPPTRATPPSYYFIVSRLVGPKGIDLAIEAAKKLGFRLKIAGIASGYGSVTTESAENIEFLGFVSDEELVSLYKNAKAFLALAEDEDFGITPVEAMWCGTPVIAYYGGGYKETVVDGKTGVFFKEQSAESLILAIKRFETLKIKAEDCKKQAEKFSKERFKKEIKAFIEKNTE